MDWYTRLMGGSGYNMSDAYSSGELWGLGSSASSGSSAGFWGNLVGGMLGMGSKSNSDGSMNWGNITGGLLGGVAQGALAYTAKDKMSDKYFKRQKELELLRAEQAREIYSHQLAEQERYRQMHGEQLANALSGYAQFNGMQSNPYGALANVPSPYNMQAPQGLLSYGF